MYLNVDLGETNTKGI